MASGACGVSKRKIRLQTIISGTLILRTFLIQHHIPPTKAIHSVCSQNKEWPLMDLETIKVAVELLKDTANGVKWLGKGVVSKHCRHCTGIDDVCACNNGCRTKNNTQCSAVWNHCRHCRGLAGKACCCPCGCAAQNPVECAHNYTCDRCCLREFTGPVFLCRHCPDYGVCKDCYETNEHDIHSFNRVSWPGALPVVLAAVNPGRMQPQTSTPQTSPNPKIVNNSAATAPPRGPSVHYAVSCDRCGCSPIQGTRFKCVDCPDFDLCQLCYNADHHGHHGFHCYSAPQVLAATHAPKLPPAPVPAQLSAQAPSAFLASTGIGGACTCCRGPNASIYNGVVGGGLTYICTQCCTAQINKSTAKRKTHKPKRFERRWRCVCLVPVPKCSDI
jgi:Zinc finger, ZZ type